MALVARGLALLVVLPVRLGWELLAAIGRWLHRWVLVPTARFIDRWLLRPLSWLLHHLVWIPVGWMARAVRWLWLTLVWSPLTWLGNGVRWLWRNAFWPPLRWCGRGVAWACRWVVHGLAWLVSTLILVPLYHLLWVPLAWLVRVLTPAVRLLLVTLGGWLHALARRSVIVLDWAWRVAGRILWWCWALTLRPVWLAGRRLWRATVLPVGRAVGAAWRVTVTPMIRWLRGSVLDPVRQATREALTTLGLRR
ncbi:hypothetical protein C1I93_29005 [Micromonospora endophytica]|uniref:Uncharacterized protein n=1 Tax=Micromonospora endophytica TaxID=515350 RepID=A0A2W2CH77_9ACTN|nr:hypothetical protein C1I93_29005 [Micromonospora endophytica]